MPAPPGRDLALIQRFCDEQVPDHVRDKKRIEMTRRGLSVTIWECDAPHVMHTDDWFRVPVAKLKYDDEYRTWTLHWSDRNSRFHRYESTKPGNVETLLREIDDDPTGIFWG